VKLDGLSEQAPEVPTKVWGQVERQLRERSQG
jgi:hypothetical protein